MEYELVESGKKQKKKEKLARRSIWIAVILTLLIPIGGYIYTRRWTALFVLISINFGLISAILMVLESGEQASWISSIVVKIFFFIIAPIDNALAIKTVRNHVKVETTRAKEVLKRYAADERNFRGENLRGQSFKGKDLSKADFSEADIRGADFSNAILRETKFCQAKAGLQHRWFTYLFLISSMTLVIGGIFSVLNGQIVSEIFNKSSTLFGQPSSLPPIGGWILLIFLVVFFVITICQGIATGLGIIAGVFSVAAAFSVVGAFTLPFTVALAGAFSGSALFAVGGAFSIIVGFALVRTVAGAFCAAVLVVITIALAIAAAIFLVGDISAVIILFVAIAIIFLSVYISWRAMKEDSRDPWIRTIAIAFASIGGTSFRGADLTNADFTGATLKSTDFRDFYNNSTKLIRTCWQQVKKLNSVRLGKTYLMNTQVRQLLITGQGQNKNFDRLDLRDVNLHGSNLENTSFIDTDFYQSSLKEANLSRTILVRTNLGKADLRGANLTGSCIQDWVITESTQLDGIICDYVYLKWVNGDKRDQIPPRGKFKEGGFVTFVRYILETVELYHEKDINPRLALTVLKKMSRDYEESLDIVALGKRGERVFIQVKVSENIIRENFKEDYYFRYNSNLKLWSGNIHHFPPTVNSFIEKKITEIALEKADDFVFVDAKYVEGNYTENYQGEVNMSGEHHIQVGRDYRETHVSDEATYVEGDYYNNAESKRILAQVAAEIQQLLEELSQTYPITTTTEQMAVATKAIQQIESNPDLKQKVINAAKEGGLAGFEKAIDNPIGALITGAIKGWLEAKAE